MPGQATLCDTAPRQAHGQRESIHGLCKSNHATLRFCCCGVWVGAVDMEFGLSRTTAVTVAIAVGARACRQRLRAGRGVGWGAGDLQGNCQSDPACSFFSYFHSSTSCVKHLAGCSPPNPHCACPQNPLVLTLICRVRH
eukprot:3936214-Rhodomonas_salina.2